MCESRARARIASLPMYPSNRPQVQAWWSTLATRLADLGVPDAPATLAWPDQLPEHWTAPELLLSQACGYPLVTFLDARVQVVGALHYRAPGCSGVFNRSQVIVRDKHPARNLQDLRGTTVAFNGTDSQSGYNALLAMVAALGGGNTFFGDRVSTGSHQGSVLAVRDGQADVAAIDCVSLASMLRHLPDMARGVRALAQSDPYPGLPLITSIGTSATDLAAIRAALSWAVQEPSLADVRADLLLSGFEPLTRADYQICSQMRQQSLTLGSSIL